MENTTIICPKGMPVENGYWFDSDGRFRQYAGYVPHYIEEQVKDGEFYKRVYQNCYDFWLTLGIDWLDELDFEEEGTILTIEDLCIHSYVPEAAAWHRETKGRHLEELKTQNPYAYEQVMKELKVAPQTGRELNQ